VTAFSSPAIAAAALPGACSLGDSADVSCGEPARHSVGAVLPDPIRQAEDELDDAIRDLKTLAALAEDAGQIHTAIDFTSRCLAASRSRTPEHKERLAREHLAAVEATLDHGVDFFQVEGRRMRDQQEGPLA
jgi:hypothetical protein